MTGDRLGTAEIMRRTGPSKPSVWRWQQRYIEAGVDGLLRDKTRPSRIPKLSDEKVAAVVRLTLEQDPPADATHWTVRAMAERSGVSTAPPWPAGPVPFGNRIDRLPTIDGGPHLAGERPRPASLPPIQAVQRPGFRRQGRGCRRALCRSATARGGAVDRREVADSGAGPNATGFADEARPSRDHGP